MLGRRLLWTVKCEAVTLYQSLRLQWTPLPCMHLCCRYFVLTYSRVSINSLSDTYAVWRMSNAFCFALLLFWHTDFNLPDGRVAPRLNYIMDLGQFNIINADISPTSHLIIQQEGGQKCKIWPRFSITVALSRLVSKQAMYLKCKTTNGAPIISLIFCPNLV